jgi:hypothetical protein
LDRSATAQNAGSASSTMAANGSAAGVGLINGWLRGQSPAWDQWDVGGQFRLRYELKDNAGSFPNLDFVRDANNDNSYLLLREKLHLGFMPDPWFKVFLEGQNDTVDWDKRSLSPFADKFDLHQGYFVVGEPKKSPVTFKIGRQELTYGDDRFISASEWNSVQRTFDAAKIRYESDALWVDAFFARVVLPKDDHFDQSNPHDNLFALYTSARRLVSWQDTEVYFLSHNVGPESYNLIANGSHGTRPRDIYSLGTRWKSLPGQLRGWDYTLEIIGQFGSADNSGAQRLGQESYGLFGSGGFTWTNAWSRPRLGLGYEGGSGDSNSKDGKSETFENLFGAPHKFYGQMDLFGPRNMRIPRISASFNPTKNLFVTADYLLFWLADTHDSLYPETAAARSGNGYGIHPGFNSFVGSELDLVASYTVKRVADLQLGFGHFFVGDYIKQSVGSVPANGGAMDANWFYVQTRINF